MAQEEICHQSVTTFAPLMLSSSKDRPYSRVGATSSVNNDDPL